MDGISDENMGYIVKLMKKLAKLISWLIELAFRRGYREGRKIGKLGFCFRVGPVTNKKPMPLELKLTTEQQVAVRIKPTTPKGQPAQLDGLPAWSVAVGDVTLQPSQDGLSCVIVSADTAGLSQVLVTADADLGEGVETVSDTIAVDVASPRATNLGLAADPPELKP
jgi:hypothetical protein